MLESTGKVLADGKISDAAPTAAPVAPEIPVVRAQQTVGEYAAEIQRKAKEAAAAPVTPAVVAPAVPVPPVVPAPPAPVPPVAPVNQPKLRPKPAPVVQPAPLAVQPPAPAAPAPPVADPDAALIASLDEDARVELEIAAVAEQRFPELKGKRQETLTYFRKVEDYATKNPNASQEDLDAFITANKPQWKSLTQKRRAEAAYFAGDEIKQGVEAVRAELQPQLNAAQNRIRQQELQPVIERQMSDLSSAITSADSLPDPSMESIPIDVAKRISEVGYEQAVKEFKVEAPIFQGAMNAGRAYSRMANGLDQRDPNNPLQNFVINFVQQQGQIFTQRPESETTAEGRKFLPLQQYNQTVAANPQSAGLYYTFGEKDVQDLLAINANMQYNAELKSLESAGFKREKRSKVGNPATPAPPAPAIPPVVAAPPQGGSPKVRPSPPATPGTAVPVRSESLSLLESLAPGAAARLGIT